MKIGYSKTFPLPNGYYEKNWIEEDELLHGLNLFDISDEDITKLMVNVRRIQYAIRKQVTDFHFESTKAAEKQEAIVTEEKMTITDVADLIKEINFCKDKDVLEKTYKIISKTDPDLQNAYDKKLKSLQ